MHADLSGFVRLTEGEEDLTFNHLRLVRSEVWRPAIESAGGSVVHSNGDAMLVEFDSALAAVAAAIDIQERMAKFNDPLDEDQKLLFRIGVHLGEVIVDEENHDLFGDGVNLAERIQTDGRTGRHRRVARGPRRHRAAGRVRLRRWRRAPGQACQPAAAHLPCAGPGGRLDADHDVRRADGRRCASTAPT